MQADEAELARDGCWRRRPAHPSARTGHGTARRSVGDGATCRSPRTVAELDECIDSDGAPSARDDQRVDVDADDVGAGRRPAPTARAAPTAVAPGRLRVRHGTRRAVVWVDRPSIISAASIALIGAGRNCTSAMASAITPPMPSMTLAPNCGSRTTPGDQLAIARDHRCDQQRHVAVGGRRLARAVRWPRPRPPRRRQAAVAPVHARSCGRSAAPQSLTTTG